MADNVRINTTAVSLSSYDVKVGASVTINVTTEAQELFNVITPLLEFPYYAPASGSSIGSIDDVWKPSTSYSITSVSVSINGSTYSLTKNTSGVWTKTFTAPSTTSYGQTSNKYGLALTIKCSDGSTQTLTRTDSTFGSYLQLRVRETTLPTVTPTAPSSGSYQKSSTVTCECTISDSESGINSSTIKFYLDGSLKTGWSYANNTLTYTATGLGQGSHSFYVVATDNDGNTRTGSTRQFYVDTADPSLSVTSPTNNLATASNTVTVSGTASDSQSGLKSVTVNGTTVTVSSSGSFSKSVSLSAGSNTITVVATDNAGRTTTISRTVIYDTEAPSLSVTSPADGYCTTSSSVTVSGTVSDSQSGVAGVTVNGTEVTISGGTFSKSVTLSPGSNTITVIATDRAGRTKTVTRHVIYDTVAPSLTVTSPKNGTITKEDQILVSGTASDSQSGIKSVTINGNAVTLSDGEFSAYISLEKGSNTITIVATDMANRTTTVVRTVTRNTTRPAFASITILPNPVSTGTAYVVSAVANEEPRN